MSVTAFRADLLQGRRALVTGGGTGICRGIALALAAAGADVSIASRREEHLAPTVRELQAIGVRALSVAGDVRLPADVDRIIAQTADGPYDPGAGKFGNSIVAVTPRNFRLQDSFTPANFAFLNKTDLDLGSGTPVVFPFEKWTLVGVVDRSKLLPASAPQPGDVLVGVASNGPHTNGYSLLRRALEWVPLDLLAEISEAAVMENAP